MNKDVKQAALNAHSWVGLFLGTLLFLVCLSGTIAVFHLEFERWEQPHIQEMERVNPDAVDAALKNFLAEHPEETHHLFIVFPTSGIPRFVVENDHVAYFADEAGELIEEESVSFTRMLVDLHLSLNLPQSWGMILVSALGAIICTLVFTGIIAHKRISKDAFKLRTGGNGQQYQIDLHNRFGLWAAPFHLIIGVTGAYFGLAGVLLVLVSQLYFGGDQDAIVNKIFTPDPVVENGETFPQVGATYAQMADIAPDSKIIFTTVHEVGTADQFIEIYAHVPGKMGYSENYRFDSEGRYLGTAGYSDGHWGKQLLWSMYRLHFGDFAGLPSKALYFVLGIMLTMLCVTGVEIWLAKKAHPPLLTRLWYALVWGSVSALALTAIVDMLSTLPLFAVFWGLMVFNLVATLSTQRLNQSAWLHISAVSVLLLLVVYLINHGSGFLTVAALQLNIPMALFAAWAMWKGARLRRSAQAAF